MRMDLLTVKLLKWISLNLDADITWTLEKKYSHQYEFAIGKELLENNVLLKIFKIGK